MATSWTYADWDQQATDALKLSRLKLHLAEVRNAIAAFERQGAYEQSGQRFNLIEYLKLLNADKQSLEEALGESPAAESSFVEMVPRYDD